MAFYYKLESCYPTLNDDLYTGSDLSAYLNKYIKVCNGCYKVTQTSSQPSFLYTVDYSGVDYDNCQECYGSSIDAVCNQCPPFYDKFTLPDGTEACSSQTFCEIPSPTPPPGVAACGKIDFFFYLDNSGSISDPSWIIMLNGVIAAIDTFNNQGQFANGSLKMGISWFNNCDGIAITQELTGSYATVRAAAENIRDNRPDDGGTFPYYGFILTYNHITDPAFGRDDADKIISFVSDGAYFQCPNTTLQPLIDQMKAGTYSGPAAPFSVFPSGTETCCVNSVPFEIRFIAVGIGGGANVSQLQAIASSPNGLGQGNLYLATTFNDFAPIAQDIANGLVCQNPLPTAVPGYTVVPVAECCYKLTSCTGNIIIYTKTNLLQNNGKYVSIEGYDDNCFLVEQQPTPCLSGTVDVVITSTADYDSCDTCLPSYKAFNCKDNNISINTGNAAFAQYLGKTVKLQEYPNDCWQIGPNSQKNLPLQSLTITSSFDTCVQCDPIEYGLTNCVNGVSVLSTTDLSNYVGKVIKAENFPGLCFSVTESLCKCLKITINNQPYSINATENNLINGRPYFQFTLQNGDPMTISYSATNNQWEAYNSSTGVLKYHTTLDINCPATGYWVNDDPNFPGNMSTETCPLTILNISPSEEFNSCEPCVNC